MVVADRLCDAFRSLQDVHQYRLARNITSVVKEPRAEDKRAAARDATASGVKPRSQGACSRKTFMAFGTSSFFGGTTGQSDPGWYIFPGQQKAVQESQRNPSETLMGSCSKCPRSAQSGLQVLEYWPCKSAVSLVN